MKDKWAEIFTQKSSLDPDKLMDYLEGKLNNEDKHAVEAMLADSAFFDDAMEGLGQMKDKQKIALILQELNSHLKKNARQRNRNRKKISIPFPGWLLLATITIIVLIILAYIIYRMYTTPAA